MNPIIWLPIFALFVIHNLEEIFFDLVGWGSAHFGIDLGVDRLGFAMIITAMCLALFAIAAYYRNNKQMTRKLVVLFLYAMIAVFAWHIMISLITTSIQPGVITAAIFLPIYIFILKKVAANN